MKINKLDRYETKIESPITPAEHKRNVADMVALLEPIIEKVKNLPPSNLPLPSWAELIDELKNGSIHRQPTHIISGESEKTNEIFDTKINAKVDTGINAKVDTRNILSDSDLELLRQIQNGE